MRLFAVIVACVLAAGLPGLAAACPVCFDADGARRIAYYLTTAGMLLLPIAMGTGLVVWLRRRL
jgi:hypothetical protein